MEPRFLSKSETYQLGDGCPLYILRTLGKNKVSDFGPDLVPREAFLLVEWPVLSQRSNKYGSGDG